MEKLSLEDIIKHLQRNKGYLYDRFGVIRIGVFGSFARGEYTSSSDIDMVVEMEGNRKNIHSFLQLKRYLEKETARKIDLGFEHSLKPIVKERIKEQIIYV
jgi:predicted nucleotidyltransferase